MPTNDNNDLYLKLKLNQFISNTSAYNIKEKHTHVYKRSNLSSSIKTKEKHRDKTHG